MTMWLRGFDRTPPLDSVMAADMRKAGCPEAVISNEAYHRHWTAIHNWCNEHFGDEYAWCGNTFFFTDHDDRLLFMLRWT